MCVISLQFLPSGSKYLNSMQVGPKVPIYIYRHAYMYIYIYMYMYHLGPNYLSVEYLDP